MYYSATAQHFSTDLIFQDDPLPYPPGHFPSLSWTSDVEGYVRKAKQLSMSILRNRRYMIGRYTWSVTINIETELPVQDIKSMWSKTTRKLVARNLNALWVREPSQSNRVHYHLTLRDEISRSALEKIIEESMPSREVLPWHKSISPITDPSRNRTEWGWAFYISKARIKGRRNGQTTYDIYRDKRLLFRPCLSMNKVGEIGTFWGRRPEALWKEIQEQEQRIADGLNKPGVKKLAGVMYELTGGTVATKTIERAVGYHADSPAVQRWIEQIAADEAAVS